MAAQYIDRIKSLAAILCTAADVEGSWIRPLEPVLHQKDMFITDSWNGSNQYEETLANIYGENVLTEDDAKAIAQWTGKICRAVLYSKSFKA